MADYKIDECSTTSIGCGCKTSTECVRYNGVDLPYIPAQKGDELEKILGNLNLKLQGIDSNVNNGVYTEEFTNNTNQTLLLPRNATEVLNVFYEGFALPSSAYSFTAPKTVMLNLGAVGLVLEVSDTVIVEYK